MFNVQRSSPPHGFTRSGGSVGGREITEPASGATFGVPGFVERNSPSSGIASKSGIRLPSSGKTGSIGSTGGGSGSFFSTIFTTGGGAITVAFGATHETITIDSGSRAQVVVFQ